MSPIEIFARRGIVNEHSITRVHTLAIFADALPIRTNPTRVIACAAMRHVVFDTNAFAVAQVFPG